MTNLTDKQIADGLVEMRNSLVYSPDTGKFHWLVDRGKARFATEAGHIDEVGRPKVRVFGRNYIQSRLAWFWMTGEWPEQEIDHINGDHSDNRWCNLREATRSENERNKPARSDNKSGYKGVWQVGRKWRACVQINGYAHHLGYFRTAESAARARDKAARELHGDFYHE